MPRPDDRRVALEALPQSRSEAKTKGEVRRHFNESESESESGKSVYENLYHKRILKAISTALPCNENENESESGKSVNGNSC